MNTRRLFFSFAVLCASISSCTSVTVQMTRDELHDKIMGGWAGQAIGVTYGQPTEFRYQGTMIPDSVELVWDVNRILNNYNDDDLYMDLTFLGVVDRLGIDAPVDSFAVSFANARYNLWHANQAARYNILHGVMPPQSGHWKNNPHANDIDFQIESDFIGLMCPGMPWSALYIADKVGHIMNYGDGWYGGLFVSGMYSLAFIHDDIETIATEALKLVPVQARFHQCIAEIIDCHRNNPDDWKAAWQLCQDRWADETGCPDGQFADFNIDALVNSAYLLIGLLYGDKDFDRTIEIATRCGQDSDCNPSSAGGILGTILGYEGIPRKYTEKVEMMQDKKIAYTPYCLSEVYDASFNLALDMIGKYKGSVDGDNVTIKVQEPMNGRLEVSFEGIKASERIACGRSVSEFGTFEFDGCGIDIRGGVQNAPEDYSAQVQVSIDGKVAKVMDLPASFHARCHDLFWQFDLDNGHHTVEMAWLNPIEGASVRAWDAITYIPE